MAFLPFLSFRIHQKQELIFQEGGLLKYLKNISVFCLEGVAHYVKVMPNLIDLYIGIFLHVVPVLLQFHV